MVNTALWPPQTQHFGSVRGIRLPQWSSPPHAPPDPEMKFAVTRASDEN